MHVDRSATTSGFSCIVCGVACHSMHIYNHRIPLHSRTDDVGVYRCKGLMSKRHKQRATECVAWLTRRRSTTLFRSRVHSSFYTTTIRTHSYPYIQRKKLSYQVGYAIHASVSYKTRSSKKACRKGYITSLLLFSCLRTMVSCTEAFHQPSHQNRCQERCLPSHRIRAVARGSCVVE